MNLLKREEGLAMPLVLMILIVLTLLGTALWQYSMSELNQSVRDENKSRAYYIARAGAESVAQNIMMYPEILDNMAFDENNKVKANNVYETAHFGEVGEVEVEIEILSQYSVMIIGNGYVDGIEQQVAILMEALEPFDGVMYSSSSLSLQNSLVKKDNITGNIVSGGTVFLQGDKPKDKLDEHPNPDYTITHDKYLPFPEPKLPISEDEIDGFIEVPAISANTNWPEDGWPEDTDNNGNNALDVANESTTRYPKVITKVYEKILINNNAELTISSKTSSILVHAYDFVMDQTSHNHPRSKLILETDSENELIIVIDNHLDLGKVFVTGDGIAKIYVREGGTVAAKQKTADVGEGIESEANLILYLQKGVQMDITSNSDFQGLIYGPNAIVTMQSNSDFEGSMIVGVAQGQGGNIGLETMHEKYNWDILDDIFGRYRMIQWVQ